MVAINERQGKDAINMIFADEAKEIINATWNMLNANRSNLSQLSEKNALFQRSHGTSTAYGADDIFEEELAAVIAFIESKGTGSIANIDSKLTGKVTGNIRLEQALDGTVVEIMNSLTERLPKKIQEKYQEGSSYTRPVSRAIKTDVVGIPATVEFTSSLNSNWEQLFQLFQGHSFSVKNYRSNTKREILDIHLGDSDYFKAIYGVLSGVGYTQHHIEKIFYRSMNRLINPSTNDGDKDGAIQKHIYHLRFIYELTGVGLYDSTGEPISGTDFIIYNDPVTENVYVQSTAQLIYEELERQTISRSALGSMSISKSRFK